MDILESLEIRWFLADQHPSLATAQTWFVSAALEGSRHDEYLITGRDDLGFKARVVENQPAKVEAKYLVGSLEAVQIAPGVVGKLERWRKLSLTLDDPMLKRDGTWLTVEKARRLRKFAFEGGHSLEVPVTSHPVAGCGIELTQLRVHDDDHSSVRVEWTLGVEAFGPETTLLEILQSAWHAAVHAGLRVELTTEQSMSYPHWVALPVGQTR